MGNQVRPIVVMLLLLTVITGVFYPLMMLGTAQLVFPRQANGSLIEQVSSSGAGGQIVGSDLIGQSFNGPLYFWGRPSATAPLPYNAAASSGSNLAPTNSGLEENVHAWLAALHAADPGSALAVPVDLAMASGSGVDPHISPAAAHYQVSRVARARGLSEAELSRLVDANTDGRQFGFLGEPRVNVLRLNLALNALHQPGGPSEARP